MSSVTTGKITAKPQQPAQRKFSRFHLPSSNKIIIKVLVKKIISKDKLISYEFIQRMNEYSTLINAFFQIHLINQINLLNIFSNFLILNDLFD